MAGVILTVTPAQDGRVEAEGNRKNTEPVGCKPKFRIREDCITGVDGAPMVVRCSAASSSTWTSKQPACTQRINAS